MTAKKLAVAPQGKGKIKTTTINGAIVIHLSDEPEAMAKLDRAINQWKSTDWPKLSGMLERAGVTPQGYVLNQTHYLATCEVADDRFAKGDLAIIPMDDEPPFNNQGGFDNDAGTDNADDDAEDALAELFAGL